MATRLRLVVSGLTVLIAFLLLAIVACGGGGGKGESTPTPVASEMEDQLKRMALQLEDLPSGVIRAEEFFTTNEQSAAESDDREGRLAMLNEWGRVLGYEATYQPNPEVMSQTGLILINSSASLYSSEEGASASFADAAQTARTTDWSTLFSGAKDVQMEEVTSPPLTDEMLWLRITAKGEVGAQPQEETFIQDVVILRQGPARASLMVAWVTDGGSSDFMQQLAEAQAQRLKAALP